MKFKKLISVIAAAALMFSFAFSASAVSDAAEVKKVTDVSASEETAQPQSAASGITSGGIYNIKSAYSGKYINVHYGVDANGTNVYQWDADGSTEQKFKVVYNSSTDCYKIYAMCSSSGTNRVLDVVRDGAPLAPGQNVDIWTEVDATAQQMNIVPVSGGMYYIGMKAAPELVITTRGTANGTSGGTAYDSPGNVHITVYEGAQNQLWYFEPVGGGSSGGTAASPHGFLDDVTSTTISGWAWRSDMPNEPIAVHVYIINTETQAQTITSVSADVYRADLLNAGIGNGCHGFAMSVNWEDYAAGTYKVYAYGIGANGDNPGLTNCPKYYTNGGGSSSGSTLSLNSPASGNLTSGSSTFYFTPTYTGLYAVETSGSTDTYMTVTSSYLGNTLTYTDDDSGDGTNSSIGFRQTSGVTATITVRHASNLSGNYPFTITVRAQKGSIITMRYSSSDTSESLKDLTSAAEVPNSKLTQMDYTPINRINPSFDALCGSGGFFSNEVVFFAGHGDTFGRILLTGGHTVNGSELPSMKNTKLAVWSACYSAYTGTSTSIAESAVNKGAKASLGWTSTIYFDTSKPWTDSLFGFLAQSANIRTAAATASLSYADTNAIHNWKIFGDTTTAINNVQLNTKASAGNATAAKFEKAMASSTNDYEAVNLNEYCVRYYKTVNGMRTNDYYDVYKDWDLILKSKETFSTADVKTAQSKQFITAERENIMNRYEGKENLHTREEEMYIKNGTDIIPVRIMHIEYTDSLGMPEEDIVCVDMSTGLELNYFDICVSR